MEITDIDAVRFSTSKGDLIVEPLEFLVDLLIRLVSRISGEAFAQAISGEWRFQHWTVLVAMVICLGLVIRFVLKRLRATGVDS